MLLRMTRNSLVQYSKKRPKQNRDTRPSPPKHLQNKKSKKKWLIIWEEMRPIMEAKIKEIVKSDTCYNHIV